MYFSVRYTSQYILHIHVCVCACASARVSKKVTRPSAIQLTNSSRSTRTSLRNSKKNPLITNGRYTGLQSLDNPLRSSSAMHMYLYSYLNASIFADCTVRRLNARWFNNIILANFHCRYFTALLTCNANDCRHNISYLQLRQ